MFFIFHKLFRATGVVCVIAAKNHGNICY